VMADKPRACEQVKRPGAGQNHSHCGLRSTFSIMMLGTVP